MNIKEAYISINEGKEISLDQFNAMMDKELAKFSKNMKNLIKKQNVSADDLDDNGHSSLEDYIQESYIEDSDQIDAAIEAWVGQ